MQRVLVPGIPGALVRLAVSLRNICHRGRRGSCWVGLLSTLVRLPQPFASEQPCPPVLQSIGGADFAIKQILPDADDGAVSDRDWAVVLPVLLAVNQGSDLRLQGPRIEVAAHPHQPAVLRLHIAVNAGGLLAMAVIHLELNALGLSVLIGSMLAFAHSATTANDGPMFAHGEGLTDLAVQLTVFVQGLKPPTLWRFEQADDVGAQSVHRLGLFRVEVLDHVSLRLGIQSCQLPSHNGLHAPFLAEVAQALYTDLRCVGPCLGALLLQQQGVQVLVHLFSLFLSDGKDDFLVNHGLRLLDLALCAPQHKSAQCFALLRFNHGGLDANMPLHFLQSVAAPAHDAGQCLLRQLNLLSDHCVGIPDTSGNEDLWGNNSHLQRQARRGSCVPNCCIGWGAPIAGSSGLRSRSRCGGRSRGRSIQCRWRCVGRPGRRRPQEVHFPSLSPQVHAALARVPTEHFRRGCVETEREASSFVKDPLVLHAVGHNPSKRNRLFDELGRGRLVEEGLSGRCLDSGILLSRSLALAALAVLVAIRAAVATLGCGYACGACRLCHRGPGNISVGACAIGNSIGNKAWRDGALRFRFGLRSRIWLG
mmetsp:Transcript_22559/g.64991  ORF Transcript_22559/g.64991 Transcript_22559/m.64991 type:complete len:592 (+) Transcript_22559:524-2299(+)